MANMKLGYRLPGPSDAWGLRGSTALDGADDSLAVVEMVYVRLAVLGTRLSPFDGVP